MKADAVLLFFLLLRYAYEKNPLRYALLAGFLQQFPETLPEGYRSPLDIVRIIDAALTTQPSSLTQVTIRSADDPARQLREFAASFRRF